MPTIRVATSSDLAAVATYLAHALAGPGGEARYRTFFDYTWLDKPDLGVLLEDDGRIRGFIGAIYSDRSYGRVCNLTSIAVDVAYRGSTLQLFSALLKRKELTFTCFSASEHVAKILDFFKFQHRPSERVVVGPISGLAGLRHVGRARVVTDAATLEGELAPEHRVISQDHRAYRCGQLLLEAGQRRCFAVTIRRGRGAKAFADVLYASDPELLIDHLPWIHWPLFRAHGTVLTGIDRAWIAHPPRLALTYRKLRPVYLRSGNLDLDRIDALYSELVPMYGHR